MVLGLVIWAVITVAGGGNLRQEADTSAVFLIIPVLIATLIPLAFLGAAAYGIYKLRQVLPPFFHSVQGIFSRIETTSRNVADQVAEPIFFLGKIGAAVRAIFHRK